jgi:FtsH-binding integral membrane protein
MNELFALVLLILGLLALGVLRRFLRNRQRLRLHEMAHQERMLALEKGLPASEVPAGGDFDAWLDEAWTDRALQAGWDRRIALALGLVMLFASIGALLFAWLMPAYTRDAVDLKIAAGLAVIPLMASFGLLLYHRLTAPKGQ